MRTVPLVTRRRTAYASVLAITMAVIAGCNKPDAPPSASSRESQRSDRPNVVLVLLDDLGVEEFPFMPRSRRLVGDSGVTLNNAFVSSPLCCPSRVSLLRGQYPHNTGVTANGGADGGFEAAYQKGVERSTLAVWLSAAGYRTALFGKYLNFYPRGAGEKYIPPGWTDWGVPVAGTPYREFDYSLNLNGDIREFGDGAEDYGTDVYVKLSEDFVRRSVSSDAPFFLLLAPYAPHPPATPAPRHARLFADATIPDTPSRHEQDISDKHPMMRDLPWVAPRQVSKINETYRNRLRSLQAVDEGVERLIAILRELGELESTVFIVTSDNGFHLLDHRLPQGKETAFEPDIRVPFLVRGPGIPRGTHLSEMVLNSDVAPTIAELAGTPIPDFVDGRSLVPLFQGRKDAAWRDAVLVIRRLPDHLRLPDSSGAIADSREGVGEYQDATEEAASPSDSLRPDGTPFLYPPAARAALAMIASYPSFDALRTADGWSYVRHEGGFVELYDLNHDPYQLENLAVTRPSAATRHKIRQLDEWTDELLRCRGESCREAEESHVP